MSTEAATIRLATPMDIDGLIALESRYYVGNLDPSQRAEGFISVLHPREWFGHAIDEGGIHIAVVDEAVAGFVAITAPPPKVPDLPAVVSAMLGLAETVEFHGSLIADQRYAIRGPVCIAAHARGYGIYSAFNAVTAAVYRDRFDLAVLFVAADNPRSLHTTTTKLGATPLAVFETEGRRYHFLAFPFRRE